jgi:hypothetical protein
MTYRWVMHDASDQVMRSTNPFESQDKAEAWLRDNWESLLDDGVRSVVLMNKAEVLYEMGLEPA